MSVDKAAAIDADDTALAWNPVGTVRAAATLACAASSAAKRISVDSAADTDAEDTKAALSAVVPAFRPAASDVLAPSALFSRIAVVSAAAVSELETSAADNEISSCGSFAVSVEDAESAQAKCAPTFNVALMVAVETSDALRPS